MVKGDGGTWAEGGDWTEGPAVGSATAHLSASGTDLPALALVWPVSV